MIVHMTSHEILALEKGRWKAVLAGDWDALASMVHEQLVYTHAHAQVDTKESYIAGLRSSKGRIRSAKRSDEQVRLLGDTAFIAGALDSDFETDGVMKQVRVRFLSIWTKTPAGWKFVGWQTTARP